MYKLDRPIGVRNSGFVRLLAVRTGYNLHRTRVVVNGQGARHSATCILVHSAFYTMLLPRPAVLSDSWYYLTMVKGIFTRVIISDVVSYKRRWPKTKMIDYTLIIYGFWRYIFNLQVVVKLFKKSSNISSMWGSPSVRDLLTPLAM